MIDLQRLAGGGGNQRTLPRADQQRARPAIRGGLIDDDKALDTQYGAEKSVTALARRWLGNLI